MDSIESGDVTNSIGAIALIRKNSAFKNRISEYILENIHHTDPKSFLNDCFPLFESETVKLLHEHHSLKIHASLKVQFVKQNISPYGEISEQTMVRYFNTKTVIITQTTDLSDFFNHDVVEKIQVKLNDFQQDGSGWAVDKVNCLTINNCKYECFNGSSYIKLPKSIEVKKAVINIQNDDEKCFLWSILAALHHNDIKSNLHRVSNYLEFEDDLNMTGITYPVSLQQIDRFEQQNPVISVNIYMHELKKIENSDNKFYCQIYPVRLSENVKKHHIHLLLTTKTEDSEDEAINLTDYLDDLTMERHYSFIKNLGKLLQNQLSVVNRRKKYFCDRCLNYFYGEYKLKMHYEICLKMNCCKITLPNKEDKFIEFKNYKHKLEVPFIVYADIEAILQPICENNEEDDNAQPKGAYQKHIPHSVGYFFHSRYPNLLKSYYRSYNGLDCMQWFVNELKEIGRTVYPILNENEPMEQMTADQEIDFDNAKICHICEKEFADINDVKCRDHSHITGEYRGAAHKNCNLEFQEPRIVPVVFHNLKYDLHLLIETLSANASRKIDIIPTTTEDYISFSATFDKYDLYLINENDQMKFHECLKFRFIDSYRFLSESLEKLASNLLRADLKITKAEWADLDDFKFGLIERKGVYPYDYIKSVAQLNETSLPPIEEFYNILNDANISQNEYDFAITVWNAFNIKTLQEYTNIYLKTDVLLLADVFENFRTASISSYHLDPAHYFTLPGYSWDAMLKITNTKIELIHGDNIDQINFFERGNLLNTNEKCAHRPISLFLFI